HAQAKMPAIEMLVPAMDVPLLSTSATWLPLGDRYCSFGSGIAMVRTVPAVQFRTLDWLPSQQMAPAGEGDPAIPHAMVLPSVKRRAAVAGSTTCSSWGPQQKGPPPWLHEATTATTRVLVPCQPTGHSVRAPATLAQLAVAGVLAWLVATTLPSMPTRLTA